MNFSSISGILLSAAAVIWVALIIPNWFKAGERRRTVRGDRSVERARAKSSQKYQGGGSLTVGEYSRSILMRRLSLLSLVGAVAGFAFAIASPSSSQLALIPTIFLSAIGILFLRRASVLRKKLLVSSLKSRARTFSTSKIAAPLTIHSEPQLGSGWQPVSVPAPMHTLNRIGTLETPILAEVKKLEVKNESVKSETIDEILRRRRAI